MNIVTILCLLLIVVKAEMLRADPQVESESGQGPFGIQNTFLDSINPGHSGDPIMGSFVYTGEDGQLYEVFYFADIYGYQAQGRLISPTLASSINRWNMRITLKGRYDAISD